MGNFSGGLNFVCTNRNVIGSLVGRKNKMDGNLPHFGEAVAKLQKLFADDFGVGVRDESGDADWTLPIACELGDVIGEVCCDVGCIGDLHHAGEVSTT